MKKIIIFTLLLIALLGFSTTRNVYADAINSDEKKEEILEISEPRNNNAILNEQHLINLDDEQTSENIWGVFMNTKVSI